MFRCQICQKKFKTYHSLSLHGSRTHKIMCDQFYVIHHLNGIWPTCKCGCGEKVEWSYKNKKFNELKQGHYSRIHNNWGHNQKAIEASTETRREQYASGKRIQWNKGLTKETNESVRLNGELCSKSYTSERRNEYSDRMKRLRDEGKIVPLHSSQHSQWNGGTSSISMLVYNDVSFYERWKRPILVRDGFKCVKCGAAKPLHVHHDKETMCEIIKKYVGDGIDTSDFNLKRSIADKVVDYHITNNVSGVTLCSKCHNEIHPSLNFG